MRTKPRETVVFLVIILFLAFLPMLGLNNPTNCTIFTLVSEDEVVFGNNEDWHTDELYIGFYPATPGEYGSVHFGYEDSSGQLNYQGVVNDQGLAWDVNSLPKSKLTPHPEKEYLHAEDNYLSMLSRKCATVEEAITLAKRFDFGDSLTIQIHIADATGDAVAITAGADGEVAFARMDSDKGYLVTTNFNLSNPDNGRRGWRFEDATRMLGLADNRTEDIYVYAGEILQAVSLNNITTFTLFSTVYDLRGNKIYMYYMSQYDEVAVLDMAEELDKGQHIVEMRELFSEETVRAGDKDYKQFESRFFAAIAATIGLLLFILYGIIRWIRRIMKRQRKEVLK